MKKFLKDVVVTFAILGLICASFYKIGWLSSSKEVATLFAIAIVVIIANKITDILVLRIRRHK
jgi:hypothetical protein